MITKHPNEMTPDEMIVLIEDCISGKKKCSRCPFDDLFEDDFFGDECRNELLRAAGAMILKLREKEEARS